MSALIAALHVVGVVLGLAATWVRHERLSGPPGEERLPGVFSADNASGLAAILIVGTGLWRLLGGLEKPTEWYLAHPLFWLKLGLFGLVFALEMLPMFTLIRWRVQLGRGERPDLGRWPLLVTIGRIELFLLVPMFAVAPLMARGVGHPGSASAGSDACHVVQLFEARCSACHSRTTRQAGLVLGRDLGPLLRPSSQWPEVARVVPSAPERSLLVEKLAGGGLRGLSMPPGAPLPPAEVERVRSWVAAGAPSCEE